MSGVDKSQPNVLLVLHNLHVIDAGCGPGNYCKALVGYGVGKLTLR